MLKIKRVLKPGGLFAVAYPVLLSGYAGCSAVPITKCPAVIYVYSEPLNCGRYQITDAVFITALAHNLCSLLVAALRVLATWRGRHRYSISRLLVWDLAKTWITRTTDRLLNPLMGKSVVMYFRNEAQ